ncbi:hypothetical protein [Cerasicoccus arenae]|uniref:Uncharacterized protein n=1 Tax=Cerasicoccus arenae TaxID=424488 RepID=A0A8J3GEZ1_9BACT|nr:hypothetical protein [Cerasicoccus arenae]MBK1858752.1 hypothetical protein [Cerasicoccus arenae]GHC07284.1 hypothetical protein GCM10007047_25480 [Cerasicoccus arenae]
MSNEKQLPDPDQLFSEAACDAESSMLFPYRKTIAVLRMKDISWRGVSKWPSERGVKTSHTSVRNFWEVYSRDETLKDDFIDTNNEARDSLFEHGSKVVGVNLAENYNELIDEREED